MNASEAKKNDVARNATFPDMKPQRIAVSGASGLVGNRLVALLENGGHEVLRLVRDREAARSPENIYWNPQATEIESEKLDGLDAVIHLAGANIADERWTDEVKSRIRDSRTDGTALVSTTISKLPTPPRTLVSASAIGYYGNRGAVRLSEDSEPGQGFLSELCRDWEATSLPAVDAGVRVVNPRIGVVLSPDGGALARMLPIFRWGAGGPVGGGKQFMSWISLEDCVGALQHCAFTDSLSGPVNVTAPNPVTNEELSYTLARLLRRPAIFRVPEFAVRKMLGEMGEALLLDSTRVLPSRLLGTRFRFFYPVLESALRAELS